jgi:CheY-like chemotaxis protein
LGLINEVLDISRIEAGRMVLNPVDFDLGDLLGSLSLMFELRCGEKQLSWRLQGRGTEPVPVRGDEAKLTQVLINLLGNAVKFTERGEVVLQLVVLPQERYRFEVIDTGAGVAAEDLKALFEPFQQGRAGQGQEGTGLGLTIAQKQLELMGSRLQVESVPGQGSRFFFEVHLPPAAGEVVAEELADWTRVQRLAPGFQIKALVADDVAANRDILQRVLERLGVEVQVAEDGRQALERMEALQPDIAFLDIRMPVLDGLETLKQIRRTEKWNEVKVVAISASVLEHERQAFLAAGFDAFVAKPLRFEQICACLAELLQVEYEYAGESAAEVEEMGVADWSDVVLPAALYARLHEAAELHMVTEIEGCLEAVEQLGEAPRRLAGHLRGLRQNYDMASILNTLGEVRHE